MGTVTPSVISTVTEGSRGLGLEGTTNQGRPFGLKDVRVGTVQDTGPDGWS